MTFHIASITLQSLIGHLSKHLSFTSKTVIFSVRDRMNGELRPISTAYHMNIFEKYPLCSGRSSTHNKCVYLLVVFSSLCQLTTRGKLSFLAAIATAALHLQPCNTGCNTPDTISVFCRTQVLFTSS